MSWLIGSPCDYCKTPCSRDTNRDPNKPKLYTPDILGMKSVVCENCMNKVIKGLEEFYNKMLEEQK